MKRFIDGASYNTDTSTLIATATYSGSDGVVIDNELYRNRFGVFFHVDTITASYKDRDGEWCERRSYDWFVVGDAASAAQWCEKHKLTILRDFGHTLEEAKLSDEPAVIAA